MKDILFSKQDSLTEYKKVRFPLLNAVFKVAPSFYVQMEALTPKIMLFKFEAATPNGPRGILISSWF